MFYNNKCNVTFIIPMVTFKCDAFLCMSISITHVMSHAISICSSQDRINLCDECSNGSENQTGHLTFFCHEWKIQLSKYKDP